MSNFEIYGPDVHEHDALTALTGDRPAEAQVRALLAIASNLNQLAYKVQQLTEVYERSARAHNQDAGHGNTRDPQRRYPG